ncbi:AMP-binding protein [Microbacterium aquimaris]|uniref:AMP-binding protein n=1 Tax=Microbacterium aquimaris TaxID=459816 RepID=UPI002AD5A6F8|nr:AMP-binding protein [Microbacterium aquimaris]MDZ8275040.1 AMP-binding protein [Microbacterium aquimaris]
MTQDASSPAAVALPRGAWEWAAAEPERPALRFRDETISFGRLVGRANQLARELRERGVTRESVVAALLLNGPEYFELSLAAGQIGAYLLPINWHLTPDEIVYILEDSGASVLFASPLPGATLVDHWDRLPETRVATGEGLEGWTAYADFAAEQSTAPIDDRTYGSIMGYTSGTTGRPKGVRREHTEVAPEEGIKLFAALLPTFGIGTSEGTHLLCSPMYHAAPFGFATGTLHYGQCVLIHERFDAAAVLDAFSNGGVTNSHMVPTHFHRMLALPEDVRAAADLSGLVAIVHAGASCPPAIKQAMLDWFGPIVWEYLGATEGTVSFVSPQVWAAKPGSVGKPPEAVNVTIRREDGTVAGPNEEGTIYFRTGAPFVYHNDPEKTEANRWGDLITVGDLGMLDEDGYLYLLDRRSDLIVSGGVNIYPAEVEAGLLTHPAVRDVGVIGMTDDEWGRRVAAVIALNPGWEPSEETVESLRAYAEEQLPKYKRPREYKFLDEFPRTDAGKVQRRKLRDIFDPERPATTMTPVG